MRPVIVILAFGAVLLNACQHAPVTHLSPAQCVEVGTVDPHGVWATKKALARAGIPACTGGSNYPLTYRILVPPEYRERAIAVLRQVEQRPLSLYGITHE